eukprot:TRINITY_DN22167_c0_g1_i1.p1 TRINITY_DN22167_c0_g1~~TRINITY_DN22167_c0_g1_i1.p1  ORF type:complete len:127 (-),score=29.28 TRINITY_DN22167_c0_g1_i1:28-408(-)
MCIRDSVEEVKVEKEEKVAEKPKEIPVEKKETEKVVAEKTSEETKEEAPKQSDTVTTQYRKLEGPNFTGQKIDLTQFKKPEKKKDPKADEKKKKKKKKKKKNNEKKTHLTKTKTPPLNHLRNTNAY